MLSFDSLPRISGKDSGVNLTSGHTELGKPTTGPVRGKMVL